MAASPPVADGPGDLALDGRIQAIAIGTYLGGAGGFVVSSVTQAVGQPIGVCQALNQYGQPIFVVPNALFTIVPTETPLLMFC